jgi:poly-gamma-glutamate synthesis protein (capsule biosynthesis protein)
MRRAILVLTACACVASPGGAAEPGVRIAAVGDNLFGRYQDREGEKTVYRRVVDRGIDPYALVAASLRGADVTFGNVETPIMDEPERFTTFRSLVFRADVECAEQLAGAGFDVISIANNHMNNMGRTAPAATRKNVEAAGLRAAGAGATRDEAQRPVLMEIDGRRVAFLAYATILNGGPPETSVGAINYLPPAELLGRAVPAVVAARRYLGADLVVVSIHWGQESTDHPDGGQRKQARALVAAGADLVLGHHPHVIQDVEWMGPALVVYSMGNFLFDAFQVTWRQSMIVHATLADDRDLGLPFRRVADVELEPIQIKHPPDRRPRPATGGEYHAARKRIERLAPGIAIKPEPRLVD